MSEINDLYLELSDSPVILEDERHIYVNRQTGKFYNSVTGILSMIKNEFKSDDVIKGLLNQYKGFVSWYETLNMPKEQMIEYLTLYVNYRQFTDSEMAEYKGEQYKRYLKKIHDYLNIYEFKNEYEYLREVNKIEKNKNIYIKGDYSIMSADEIKEMWKDMTDIANAYGNIVHITIERHILKKQKINFDDHLYNEIFKHYLWIKENIQIFYKKYPFSNHSFTEYEIDVTLGELMENIIESFENNKINWGRCVVPEKRLLYKDLCGTTDVYVDLDAKNFGLGDHKTNKDFHMENPFGQFLKPPFDQYEDTHFNIYTFQMSIYAYMIEQIFGKKLNFLYITYYSRKNSTFKIFDIDYKKDEAIWLINNYIDWIDRHKAKLLSSSLGELIKLKIKDVWMDNFTKEFMYFIKDNKGNDDKKLYIKFIDDYHYRFINYNPLKDIT